MTVGPRRVNALNGTNRETSSRVQYSVSMEISYQRGAHGPPSPYGSNEWKNPASTPSWCQEQCSHPAPPQYGQSPPSPPISKPPPGATCSAIIGSPDMSACCGPA